MTNWPWPAHGRILDTGPMQEWFPGHYSDEEKAWWQPWVDAAKAGASVEELEAIERALKEEQ